VPNPGQPTIGPGALGDAVRRLQRALRRTPDLGIKYLARSWKQPSNLSKEGAGLVADGIVGPQTWNALPDGGPMPALREGSSGAVVESLQRVLTNGASGEWGTTPQGIDGIFGPHTKASVKAFQAGPGPRSTGSSETRPGQCLCTQPVPP
jgi:peptidoglycan hydrolase-like protein with peptidoglycan-binding domain